MKTLFSCQRLALTCERASRKPGKSQYSRNLPRILNPQILRNFSLNSTTDRTSRLPRSHAPAWECSLRRSASSEMRPHRSEEDAERPGRHSHGGPWERVLNARWCSARSVNIKLLKLPRFSTCVTIQNILPYLNTSGRIGCP